QASRSDPDDNSSPTPRPAADDPRRRTYGLQHSVADHFGRLMMAAAGNRKQVVALMVWRHVKDRSWVDGASRITQAQMAKAFGVSLRTVKTWFKDAQALGLIRQDGWTVTKTAYGRVGKWLALPLPAALPAVQGLHLNEVQ